CVDGQKTRCKLTVDLASPTQLVLPLNQFSDDLILLEMDSVRIKNEFLLGSQTKELEEHAIETLHGDDDYDCLLDKMSLICEKLRVFAGKRLDAFTNRPVEKKHRRIGQEVFEDFCLEIQDENILNRPFDLNIEVFKNLSSFISHNCKWKLRSSWRNFIFLMHFILF
uniref:Reverse transcriptase domain-containing protein n=1 Tax=Bursaphelenchus xylophilus TaxID=6326 RepID=A0A1I7SPF7_BURXY